jgi:hypothetical protein
LAEGLDLVKSSKKHYVDVAKDENSNTILIKTLSRGLSKRDRSIVRAPILKILEEPAFIIVQI